MLARLEPPADSQTEIEVAPLAFMCGRTLSDCFVVLDEAQDATTEQMKMFLTRLGYGSKAVVTGHSPRVDLDIVYRITPENVARLLKVLIEVGAVFRGDARRIAPNASHLESRGHKLFETTLGDLDCLGTIEEDTDYGDLLPDVDPMVLGDLEFQVISLPRLIKVKQALTRPKDQLALMHLLATLEEREKGGA